MSLKSFHIVFIILSTALALAFGVWAARDYGESRNWIHLALGIASFAASGVLAVYGVWFLRKLKGVSYL